MASPKLVPLTGWTKEYVEEIGCEMAESERPCAETPLYALDASSYVKPMLCCKRHAEEQMVYFGAVVTDHTPVPKPTTQERIAAAIRFAESVCTKARVA